MKRWLYGVLLLAALLPARVLAAEDWLIKDYKVALDIQRSGILDVKEDIKVDFALDPHHGIYRDIPYAYRKSDGSTSYSELKVIDVTQDGEAAKFQEIRNSANIRIKIGDADRTITGLHEYVIHYTVIGALASFSDHDELYWNATGNGWGQLIEKASAAVTLPGKATATACYQGPVGSKDSCQAAGTNFSATDLLTPGEGLTVAVAFKKGLVPILVGHAPPTLASEARQPVVIGLFGLLSIAGVGWVLRRWLKHGRDRWWQKRAALGEAQSDQVRPFGAHENVIVEYEPPEGLRPAEVGVLADEKADTKDIVATIVDLAVRGYLKITELPKKWHFGSTDYQLDQVKPGDKSLREYERLLLIKLFEASESVKVSDLKNTFYTDLKEVKGSLYKEVTGRKLFAKNPETVRIMELVFAILVGGTGIGIIVLGAVNFLDHPWLVYIVASGAALTLTGVVWLALSQRMPARTAHGREMYLRTKGYEQFINGVEKYPQRFHENENYFTEVLPYAIIFGATKKLAKAMKDMGIQPKNTGYWYVGSGPFNVEAFGSSMDSFASSLSSAVASAPSGSGVGGGGFSGGGGGGGGGGGW